MDIPSGYIQYPMKNLGLDERGENNVAVLLKFNPVAHHLPLKSR